MEYVNNTKRRTSFISVDGHAEENIIYYLFVRVGKSEAEVTNNNRLIMRSRYCTIES